MPVPEPPTVPNRREPAAPVPPDATTATPPPDPFATRPPEGDGFTTRGPEGDPAAGSTAVGGSERPADLPDALRRAAAAMEAFLDTPADPGATAPPVPAPRPAGAGRYRVVRAHARGGLGEVFVAEDTELRRQVALKE